MPLLLLLVLLLCINVAMGAPAYHTLLGEDVSYPDDLPHSYLKLFSHAWNFGRFDLGVLALEWSLYLIFTAFIAAKAALIVKWDFANVSIPFYIALALGCIRSAFWFVRSILYSSHLHSLFSY